MDEHYGRRELERFVAWCDTQPGDDKDQRRLMRDVEKFLATRKGEA